MVLSGIDLIVIDVEHLSVCLYFTLCDYNLPLESWPCLEFFSNDLPRHFLRAGVNYNPAGLVAV